MLNLLCPNVPEKKRLNDDENEHIEQWNEKIDGEMFLVLHVFPARYFSFFSSSIVIKRHMAGSFVRDVGVQNSGLLFYSPEPRKQFLAVLLVTMFVVAFEIVLYTQAVVVLARKSIDRVGVPLFQNAPVV